MRTLVVHTGGIGDFLLTCPALSHLQKEGPLTLAGIPDRIVIAVDAGIAERAVSLDQIRFDSIFSEPANELREFLAPMDRIVVWMRDSDGQLRAGLETITNVPIDIFPGLPSADWSRHASEYFCECLGYDDVPEFKISPTKSDQAHDVIIHPGSGGQQKNWPMEHFEELSAYLVAKNRNVTWSLGPAEREQGTAPQSGETLSCNSLRDLAGHLANCTLYVGNDSGITHLAAAVGVRTLALFGPTQSRVWAPRGEHVTVLENAIDDPRTTLGELIRCVESS